VNGPGGIPPATNGIAITTAGNVGIGTTTPSQGKLHVANIDTAVYATSSGGYGVYGSSGGMGAAGVYGTSSAPGGYAGYFAGNLHYTGTLTQGSDVRLKQGVTNLGYGLREVLQLRPVTWNWKAKLDNGQQLGLIAQEVEAVLPELVSTEKDAEQTKGLNYIGLVPVTIKAIQEQQAQIEDQQKRIAELEKQKLHQQEQNGKLEERLAALEALLGKVSSHAAVEQQ
jgi:hypothetical protein